MKQFKRYFILLLLTIGLITAYYLTHNSTYNNWVKCVETSDYSDSALYGCDIQYNNQIHFNIHFKFYQSWKLTTTTTKTKI